MVDQKALQAAAEVAADWGSPIHVRALVLLGATGLGIYWCYAMSVPFAPALAWALALAVLFSPMHQWIEGHVRGPNLAASTCVVLVAVIGVIPIAFVGNHLLTEAVRAIEMIRALVASGEWRASGAGSKSSSTCPDWCRQPARG
jgi:predicted PurR-regulated permease PerM